MSDKKRILVVDDSPNEIRILMELLKQDYAVVAAKSGEKAIELVQGDNPPDLVLMDVTMEPMDGYEACHAIHEIDKNIPVIFVSANTQTDEILKGFDAGGLDYLTKPIEEKVLLNKLNIVFRVTSACDELEAEKVLAAGMASHALSSAGKLGVLLNFLRCGIKLLSHEELAEKIVQACAGFELESSVQVRADSVINASSSGVINPLESELLTRSVDMEGRLLERGSRLIVCFESVSVLIKNIPEDDEAVRGEIKDNLMIIAEDAHNLNLKVGQEKNLNNKRESIVAKALKESQSALQEFEIYQKEHKERSIKIMDDLMTEIEGSYFDMGLSDDQEQKISDIISLKTQEALEHMEGGLHLDEQMKAISGSLGEIAKSL